MQMSDEVAAKIIDAGQRFQGKLTRMMARLAEDGKRDEMTADDLRLALAMLLSREALENWNGKA